jgi:hypothetical protein
MNRPTPDQVVEIVSELGSDGKSVSVPEIVARIRMRIGCSRATALPWGGEGLRCWGNRPGDGIQSYVFSVRSGWRRLAERFRA